MSVDMIKITDNFMTKSNQTELLYQKAQKSELQKEARKRKFRRRKIIIRHSMTQSTRIAALFETILINIWAKQITILLLTTQLIRQFKRRKCTLMNHIWTIAPQKTKTHHSQCLQTFQTPTTKPKSTTSVSSQRNIIT